MLRQHSALVRTCFGKYAIYLSPVLVPIHHESSPLLDFQTCSFIVYLQGNISASSQEWEGPYFVKFRHRQISSHLFAQTAKKSTLPTLHRAVLSLLSNNLFPSRWGSKGISTPFSTTEERATFSTRTLKKEPRVRQELSASGPVSWSGNASFFPPS